MPREQKVTIKVNHCIEIWSPVNFHMLRNKTLVVPGRRMEIPWPVSCVSFCDRTETDGWGVPPHPPHKKWLEYILKSTHDYSQSGKPFLICLCCMLTHSGQLCCHNKEAGESLLTDTLTRRVCWNCTTMTRQGCLLWNKCLFWTGTVLQHYLAIKIPFEFTLSSITDRNISFIRNKAFITSFKRSGWHTGHDVILA